MAGPQGARRARWGARLGGAAAAAAMLWVGAGMALPPAASADACNPDIPQYQQSGCTQGSGSGAGGGTTPTSATPAAAVSVVVVLTLGSSAATVNGKPLTLDVPAQLSPQGRTMVPFRFLGQALGARVGWNQAAQTAIYQLASTRVLVVLGAPSATVNGKSIALDTPATVIQGRTLVPLRFVSEALGAQVAWDGTTQTITVTL